jgi:iron complex outermembrane receptor protein
LLRGPQGTLFGKNTTAGAITITTEAPAFTPQGAVQVTGGNLGYFQAQGTVSGPLVDDVLAGRLTAYLTSRSGWVHDATNDRDLDNIHRDGVRGQLLFTPTQDFRLRLIGEYHEENDANGATVFNSWGATPAAWQKKLAVVGGQIVVSPDGDVTAEDGPQAMRARQAAFTAQADWNLGGGLTLTSITGWRHWSYSSAGDAEGTSADILNGFYKIKDDQFSQELRLATPKDRTVELTAGLYFFGQNQDVDQILEYGSSAAAYLSGISPALLPAYAQASPQIATLLSFNNSRWDVRSKPKERSYALFGQAIWHATPQLDVTLGLRGTYETKNEVVWRPTPVATATGQPITALASQAFAPSSVGVTDRAPSGLLSLNYRFTRDVMAYASVSQGEKAGGVSTTLPASGLGLDSLKVKPEVAQDFEMGIKSQFLDRKVTLNADVFYTRVRDYQATYFQTPQGASAAVQVLTNVGRVETRGVEVEASARPLDGLTLKLAASYNDAFYASYASGPCAAEIGGSSCNLTGRPVAGAPRWITNLSGYYERQLNNRITGYVGGEYSWRSSYYGYLDDSAYARTGDYGLLNLRFGARRDDGRWDLTVWAKNLTNERYAANYISFSSLAPGAYAPFFGDPRTYGVTLRSAF